ncbi:hypothetical protein PT285_00525 [Lactobacillus sp. ESL0791]|uniref:type II toxin-antitoxin system PemI/MazE family antitoxin n=1 Tax=Lactobacillus sp. ESL0791 TaxID=2983234 RepID=UPI0023F9A289|nr:hypothetical protein [Lactobacillus sp. ESL0791]MDF7637924.1 hypothetical protein [Lactobacillus sp. ESL0791]
MTVKARIQGNTAVATLPKSLNVKPGTLYNPKINSKGVITFTPTKNALNTIEKLFKDWHGNYQTPDDLKDWDTIKPVD